MNLKANRQIIRIWPKVSAGISRWYTDLTSYCLFIAHPYHFNYAFPEVGGNTVFLTLMLFLKVYYEIQKCDDYI